ncbi:hypothetical protein C1646_821817 [Rhizophagus diaphanus]|nr:hypothetical protein C1646_821817 [Rhizophagus diaphanus] [Rhizophagus sp. MUCL 43196]
MDLDTSNAYYKLCSSDRDARYNKIIKAIHLLQDKHDNETPEMWCSCIRSPFRKILLEENPEIFSKNRYIRMYAKFYEDGKGKDKLASISYDYDTRTIGYETYKQDKITIAGNIMPSAPSFEPAYIPPARQKMVLPISHQSSNFKSNTSEIFISSWYAKQNNLLPSINYLNQPALRLRDGTKITFV